MVRGRTIRYRRQRAISGLLLDVASIVPAKTAQVPCCVLLLPPFRLRPRWRAPAARRAAYFLPLAYKFHPQKQNRAEPAEEGVGLKAISPKRAGKCPRPARVEGTSAQAPKLAEPAQNDGRWFAVEVWIFEHSGAPATAPPRSACGMPVGRAPEHCGAGLQALRASRRRRRTISAHWQGPSTACGTAQRSQCFRP